MKTAEEILKSKLDGKITFVNNPDYTFNKVIEAMEEYRLQSHPSPMSAEQVDWRQVIKDRVKHFNSIFHSYEARQLVGALYAIDQLVPPSHFAPSPPAKPMSAEQVEELGYYYPLFKFFSDEHGLSLLDSQLQDVIHECKKFIEPASPSVKADGWVSVEDELPKVGQKVDLWLVPDDEEKSYRMTWTWEKESTARITINGCKVTHWQPFAPPKQK